MLLMVIFLWLFISAAWFAVNAYVIDRFDANFWFVSTLPFWIGLLFIIGARVVVGGWKEPPDNLHY